ncbi:uncharacterized protein LOC114739399 [Neltuma alba]|uniref:uncharacterized protein LOC114739399 n=1 Tax=Neltuma alba TaxID=207710 RepID=UPI0010A3D7E0|nr:uncharacterized protein LOC114739399 [Prosopis alba]
MAYKTVGCKIPEESRSNLKKLRLGMEEIRSAAKAVYANLSDEAKRETVDLFRSVDKNGDGKISLQEFLTSSHNTTVLLGGNNLTANRRIFDLVDQNGDGTLQFDEFLTLVYMRASPRPWCNGCGNFIAGLFFSCTQCRLGNKGVWEMTFDLCIPCYHGRRFVHEHADFEDNYSLLARMQHSPSSPSPSPTISSPQSSDASNRMKEKVKKSFRRFADVVSLAADVDQLSSHIA